MTCHFFAVQQMQDPVRLTLPGTQTFTMSDASLAPVTATITVDRTGILVLDTSGSPSPSIPNYVTSVGAWWGRTSQYPAGGAGILQYPGMFWEARADIISGAFTATSGTFGSFIRITPGSAPSTIWTVQRTAVGTDTGTVRISFRKFGGSTTLGTVDFALTLNRIS